MSYRNDDVKRIKLPKYLDPIEALEDNLSTKRRRHTKNKPKTSTKRSPYENVKINKRPATTKNNRLQRIPNCCTSASCQCDPGDLDEFLTEKDKENWTQNTEYDPYSWMNVKNRPNHSRSQTEQHLGAIGILLQEDETWPVYKDAQIKHKRDSQRHQELEVFGVRIRKPGKSKLNDPLKEIKSLEDAGCIEKLKVVKSGLSFEVNNQYPTQQQGKAPAACHDRKGHLFPLGGIDTARIWSKMATIEQLQGKLRFAECDLNSTTRDCLSQYRAMVAQLNQRSQQAQILERDRIEEGLKKMERRLTLLLSSGRRQTSSLRSKIQALRRVSTAAECQGYREMCHSSGDDVNLPQKACSPLTRIMSDCSGESPWPRNTSYSESARPGTTSCSTPVTAGNGRDDKHRSSKKHSSLADVQSAAASATDRKLAVNRKPGSADAADKSSAHENDLA